MITFLIIISVVMLIWLVYQIYQIYKLPLRRRRSKLIKRGRKACKRNDERVWKHLPICPHKRDGSPLSPDELDMLVGLVDEALEKKHKK